MHQNERDKCWQRHKAKRPSLLACGDASCTSKHEEEGYRMTHQFHSWGFMQGKQNPCVQEMSACLSSRQVHKLQTCRQPKGLRSGFGTVEGPRAAHTDTSWRAHYASSKRKENDCKEGEGKKKKQDFLVYFLPALFSPPPSSFLLALQCGCPHPQKCPLQVTNE